MNYIRRIFALAIAASISSIGAMEELRKKKDTHKAKQDIATEVSSELPLGSGLLIPTPHSSIMADYNMEKIPAPTFFHRNTSLITASKFNPSDKYFQHNKTVWEQERKAFFGVMLTEGLKRSDEAARRRRDLEQKSLAHQEAWLRSLPSLLVDPEQSANK